MSMLSNLMTWGIRLKSREIDENAPLTRSVWINKPLEEANLLLPKFMAGRNWHWRADADRSGKLTRLEATLQRGSSPDSELPRDLVLLTDLRAVKSLVEAGEAPTVEGQPHGARSFLGRSVENVFQEIHP